MRFHVLGIGSIGTLVAHNLRLAQPSADICLVVRNADVFRKKRDVQLRDGPVLRVERSGEITQSSGYELDVSRRAARDSLRQAIEDEALNVVNTPGPIQSLIVCTKAPSTSRAIEGLHDRIKPNTVIALLQNGIGVYEELVAKFWPDRASRPQFVIGTTTHGVTPVGQGSVIHATRPGEGAIKWGIVPDPRGFDTERWLWGSAVSELPLLTPPDSPVNPLPPPPPGQSLENLHGTLTALLSMSPLNPTLLPMPHFYVESLFKLAINATINPLTAVLGGGYLQNGALLRSGPGHRLVNATIEETSQILTAYLETLSPTRQPDALRMFSAANIRRRMHAVINETSNNFSSMALDVKSGRLTEIDYINGFLVSLGNRLNIPTPNHRMLTQMVKFKAEVGGLGDNVYPQIRQIVRSGEQQSLEIRKLSLEERRISLLERDMLMRETRSADAKRAQRDLRREMKKREKRERQLAGASAREASEAREESESASEGVSEGESSEITSEGLGEDSSGASEQVVSQAPTEGSSPPDEAASVSGSSGVNKSA